MKIKRFIILLFLVGCVAPLFCQKEVTRQEVLRDEFWQLEYNQFTPDRFLVESLNQRLKEPVRIDIYLGFWCDDSKTQVPRFLRIVDYLSNRTQIKLRFLDVGPKKPKEQKFYIEALNVEKIPAFIFYRGDKEIGRIIEKPNQSLLEDMLMILF